MNPLVLLIPVAGGFAWWWSSRSGKPAAKQTAKPKQDLPPETRGPFDGPGGTEPPKPEPTREPQRAFPGPFRPQDPEGEYGPIPVTIYAGTPATKIEQWPGHERHVFITDDCGAVMVGSDWLTKIFLPAAAKLVKQSPERYHSAAAITWEILLGPFGERPGPNHAVECLRMIPDYSLHTLTAHGTFTQYVEDQNVYQAAWEDFESTHPDLAYFYKTLESELWQDKRIRPTLEAEWGDGPQEG